MTVKIPIAVHQHDYATREIKPSHVWVVFSAKNTTAFERSIYVKRVVALQDRHVVNVPLISHVISST